MLDPDRRVALPDFPQADVYRDHERPLTYYAVPAAVTVAVDDRGRPECRLTIYMKRQDGRPVPSGGQVSLTTVLGLSDQEIADITDAIEVSLTPAADGPAPAPRPSIQLLGPDWIGGRVVVALAGSFTLTGQPSLSGRNRCALVTSLTAETALLVREEWMRGLPGAIITYEMTMRVAETAAASVRIRDYRASYDAGGATEGTNTADVDVRATAAASRVVIAERPLRAPGLERLIAEIDLGHG